MNEIMSYLEMCRRERMNLQRGMNYGLPQGYSVILMSVRPGAPYEDQWDEDGTVLIYEGHDAPRTVGGPNPKTIDLPERTPNGALTQNGKFHKAAEDYKAGKRPPEKVRVYEKVKAGIWSYNGLFFLVDSWRERRNGRMVFRFKLVPAGSPDERTATPGALGERRRAIPTHVKVEVWRRDGGKCVICGARDELHFDHIVPYSKGGTSILPENVQLLCARHNLEKRDSIR